MFASTFAEGDSRQEVVIVGDSRQGVVIVGDSRQGVCLLKVIVWLQAGHAPVILNDSRHEPPKRGWHSAKSDGRHGCCAADCLCAGDTEGASVSVWFGGREAGTECLLANSE